MAPKITPVSPSMNLGEGPHWDEKTQSLYFVDIWGFTVNRFKPETNQFTSTKIFIPGRGEKPVSIIIPVKNEKNKFVITHGNDVVSMTWDGVNDASDFKILTEATEDDIAVSRINDGKCSPSGVLFAGSIAMKVDTLYDRVHNFYAFKNCQPKRLLAGVGVSNGLAWSSDEKTFYYNDSLNLQVEGFDYDAEKVEISNRRNIFNLTRHKIAAYPDGMTIDTDGNLWVACFDGSRVVKIDPKTGALLDTIMFPTPNITSVTFGGKNLDELYVTSARNQDFFRNIEEGDTTAGCTFKVTGTGSKGIAGAPIDLSNVSL